MQRAPERVYVTPVSVYSARIRAARAYAGLSQTQLADALGVDEQTIKRRESTSGNEPKKGERIAIAAICRVPPEFLELGWDAITPADISGRVDRLETQMAEMGENIIEVIMVGLDRVSGDIGTPARATASGREPGAARQGRRQRRPAGDAQ